MTSSRGFTLLELLVAVAIVGILAGIAYPSYTASVQRGWRTEGKSALMRMAQAQERHYTAFNTYTDNSGGGTADKQHVANAFSGDSSTSGRYVISVAGCAGGSIASCFVVTAQPRWSDPLCGNLTYDSVSGRGQSAGTAAQCWDR